MRVTMYSDGKSCPGNCDAHVVFQGDLNGSQFAHKPGSSFAACKKGEHCEICLLDNRRQCLEVTYRGGGPAPNTFDFTPAFFQQACAGKPVQQMLADICTKMELSAKKLEKLTNCIVNQDRPECSNIITKARIARLADEPYYNQCMQMGESKYNTGKSLFEQRTNDCAYEAKKSGGPNSKGTRWKKLLSGACRIGTFVGKDGLDCCTGVKLTDAWLGTECRAFYVSP
ncbi:hypothetical protein [Pseudomonas ogarae]|uniref:hypothetical protein n=1 Tax=Pseudomonas ogarae (strain DSM 112162 / CECT 30235 / F113) TaxID=1114970 RepID=UPI00128D4A10|nr:hypothetical protein [Pseudomonas ogarae]